MEGLVSLFKDSRAFFRLCLLVMFLASMVVLALNRWAPAHPSELQISPDGVLMKGSVESPAQVYYPLSATSLWANTGIRVRAGQTVHFQAAGAVNLAVHHSVIGAWFDSRPKAGWLTQPDQVGPGAALDRARGSARLVPEAPLGAVLAHVCCAGAVCPSGTNVAALVETREQRREQIAVVANAGGAAGAGGMVARCDGELLLSLNDNVPLQPEDYVSDPGPSKEELTGAYDRLRTGGLSRAEFRMRYLEEWGRDAIFTLQNQCPDLLGPNGEPKVTAAGAPAPTSVPVTCAAAKRSCKGFVLPKHTLDDALLAAFDPYSASKHEAPWPGDERLTCLADLQRLEQADRWEHSVKKYPTVWYDDNAGIFWITIDLEGAPPDDD